MRVERVQILDEEMWRAGLSDRSAAGTALDATLEALERLAAPDAVALAEVLPPPLAAALHRLAPGHCHTLAAGEPGNSQPPSEARPPRDTP